MFEEPLSIIRKSSHQLNPSLDNPRLPEPYEQRFGASISKIAYNTLISGSTLELPAPGRYVVDKESAKKYEKDKRENIYPTLFGNIVEFLTAYLTMGKDAAEDPLYFRQACDHIDDLYFPDPNHPRDNNPKSRYYKQKNPAHRMDWDALTDERKQLIVDNLLRLSELMNRVDEGCERQLTQQGDIAAAAEFVSFHHSLHGGRKCYSGDDAKNIVFRGTNIPTIDCERRIYCLVMRYIKWFSRTKVQSYQFSIPKKLLASPTNGVNGGRLDFVANNIIVDLKTDAKKISDSNLLQLLLYLAFIQRVETKKPVKVACIIDARNNEILAYEWDKLPEITKRQLNTMINFLGWANLKEYENIPKNKEINDRVREEVRCLIDSIR